MEVKISEIVLWIVYMFCVSGVMAGIVARHVDHENFGDYKNGVKSRITTLSQKRRFERKEKQ